MAFQSGRTKKNNRKWKKNRFFCCFNQNQIGFIGFIDVQVYRIVKCDVVVVINIAVVVVVVADSVHQHWLHSVVSASWRSRQIFEFETFRNNLKLFLTWLKIVYTLSLHTRTPHKHCVRSNRPNDSLNWWARLVGILIEFGEHMVSTSRNKISSSKSTVFRKGIALLLAYISSLSPLLTISQSLFRSIRVYLFAEDIYKDRREYQAKMKPQTENDN